MPPYVVLARKYRPRTFDEVVGQEVVTRVLRGAIEEQRIGHAYLFCGPRGTGKTTTARILAKTLNCERGGPSPCNACDRCLATDAGAEPDVVEIDAASHTGVEDVRVLRDQAAYAPMQARHKVYIVDEVHMLSRSAFNALLKTLEEPPPHVVFLFATTEPHKLPDTILSRCQVLKLDPIQEEAIVARLAEIAGLEGVEAEDGVLEEVARRARGGLRDALSLMDQLLALAGRAPRLEDLARLSEASGPRAVEAVLERVEAGDKPGVLRALPVGEGSEPQLLDELLTHLRLALVAALCGADSPHLSGSRERREQVAGRAQRLGVERLEAFLAEFVHARERMRLLPGQARLLLEMSLLELCDPERTLPLASIAERLAALERRLEGKAPTPGEVRPAPPPARPAPASPPPASPPPESPPPESPPQRPRPREPRLPERRGPAGPSGAAPTAAPEPARAAPPAGSAPLPAGGAPEEPAAFWVAFLDALARQGAGLSDALRRRGRVAAIAQDHVVVELRGLTAADRRMTRDKRNQARLRGAAQAVLGREVDVRMEESSEPSSSERDEFTHEVADLFGGTIEESR